MVGGVEESTLEIDRVSGEVLSAESVNLKKSFQSETRDDTNEDGGGRAKGQQSQPTGNKPTNCLLAKDRSRMR